MDDEWRLALAKSFCTLELGGAYNDNQQSVQVSYLSKYKTRTINL